MPCKCLNRTLLWCLPILATAALLSLLAVSGAQAESKDKPVLRDYDSQAVETAMKEGKPVLLVFSKKGCPVCARQDEALRELLPEGDLAMVQAFKVDFDKQTDVNQKHGVTSQSTLIGFKGETESKRVTGETDKSKLKQFLEEAFCS